MTAFSAESATLHVLAFREGVLSAVGHDLLLRATRFSAELSEDKSRLKVRCDAASLVVETAMRDGRPLPDAFSAADVRKIERSTREEVLEASRYPEILFETRSIDPAGTFTGTLDLHGRARELSGRWHLSDGRLEGELAIDQPAFGVRPFTAMLGALKVRREVVARLVLPVA